jgi:hypothetical protein
MKLIVAMSAHRILVREMNGGEGVSADSEPDESIVAGYHFVPAVEREQGL